MKYFLHTIKGIFKKPIQIKTKQISKRGKNKVWKGLEKAFWVLVGGNFFATFLSN